MQRSAKLLKKTIMALTLSVLILLTFAEFASIVDANWMNEPLPKIYIKSDGNIEPSTAPIQRNGNTYSLSDNIENHEIVVQCNNVVIDGNNFTLQGRHATFDQAISIERRNNQNITIMNFVIKQYYAGIRASYLFNCIITKNTIDSINAIDISPNCSSNQITYNTLIGSERGISMRIWGSANTVMANTLIGSTNGTGIRIWGAANAIIANTIYNYGSSVDFYKGENNTVSGNVLISTSEILTNEATGTILKNNTAYDGTLNLPIPKPTSAAMSDNWLNSSYYIMVIGIVLVVAFSVCLLFFRKHGNNHAYSS